MLFSATAGQIADKFEKGRLARFVKLLEIGIMLVAGIGWMTPHAVAADRGGGRHGRALDPVRPGQIRLPAAAPEARRTGRRQRRDRDGHLRRHPAGRSRWARCWSAHSRAASHWWPAARCWSRVLGLAASWRIPASPAPAPELKISRNFVAESVRNLAFSRKNRTVFLSMLGNSWFWFYGALVLSQFPRVRQGLPARRPQRVRAAADRVLAGHRRRLAAVRTAVRPQGRDRPGAVRLDRPVGVRHRPVFRQPGLHATRAPVDVARRCWRQPGMLRILVDMLLLGVFGGFFIVPLFALIQTRCDPKHVSRTIAGMNILNALFMVAAAGVAILLLGQGFTIPADVPGDRAAERAWWRSTSSRWCRNS